MKQGHQPVGNEQLLLSVAEQLKLPLLQIARQAELARLNRPPPIWRVYRPRPTAPCGSSTVIF